MSPEERIRREHAIRQAEGYLELGMPQHVLDLFGTFAEHELDGRMNHLLGEAFRELERYGEAVNRLQLATESIPDDIHILLALAWCFKRTGRVDRAIEALESALDIDPGEAILYYNLSCYCSLTGNLRYALRYLAQALAIDADFRDLIDTEDDFDAIRNDPDFQELVSVIV